MMSVRIYDVNNNSSPLDPLPKKLNKGEGFLFRCLRYRLFPIVGALMSSNFSFANENSGTFRGQSEPLKSEVISKLLNPLPLMLKVYCLNKGLPILAPHQLDTSTKLCVQQ